MTYDNGMPFFIYDRVRRGIDAVISGSCQWFIGGNEDAGSAGTGAQLTSVGW